MLKTLIAVVLQFLEAIAADDAEAELKAAQVCHVCLLKRKSLRRVA